MSEGSSMKRTLIHGALVFDGSGDPPRPGEAVLLEGNRIIAVGPIGEFVSLPGECSRIDLNGYFLLPGFINAHDHLLTKRVRGTRAERAHAGATASLAAGIGNAYVNLREGFTTVRDAGSREAASLQVKEIFESGNLVGPRISSAGSGLTVTSGYAHVWFEEVDSPLEARKAAGRLIKKGCDWIKCMASIEWERDEGEPISAVNMEVDLMRAAFELAHHHGLHCMAHAIADEAIRNAVQAGADTIEHGAMLSEATAAMLAVREIFLVPTLSGYGEHRHDWGRGEGVMRHGTRLRPFHEQAIRYARSAGVKMAYGSDSLGNLVDELVTIQELGAGVADCIVMLTRSGSELLGLSDRIGTITAGKEADLTVLSSDPRTGPAAFADVHLVFRAGRPFDPTELPILGRRHRCPAPMCG
jgi:imidazolonepropionase-like amidohydrolase